MAEQPRTEHSRDDRFEQLCSRFLDDDLTAEEFVEWAGLLEDESFAREAADRLGIHRLLGVCHQVSDPDAIGMAVMERVQTSDRHQVDQIIAGLSGHADREETSEQGARRSDRPRLDAARSWFLIAASLMLVGGLVWGWPRKQEVAPDRSGSAVATLLLGEGCRWEQGLSPEEGQRLDGRFPLRLTEGVALIRMDGGAEVLLQGSAALQLDAPGQARLLMGQAFVRTDEDASGFRLMTPTCELVDFGTEFSVVVDQAGTTELNVLDGELSAQPLGRDQGRVLPTGSAVVIDQASSKLRSVTPRNERFETALRQAKRNGRFDLLYAYAGFNYDAGPLALNDSRRGLGWKGTWRARGPLEGASPKPDATDVLDIVHGQMNVTWPVPGGRLGMLRFPPGQTVRLREMVRPVDLGRDGIYYFSLMVREPDYSQRRPGDRPIEGVRLTFRNRQDYFGECLSFGIGHQQHARLKTGVGFGMKSPSTTPSGQSTLWVGKIIARADGEDELRFRIFSEHDELGSTEPAEWHLVSRDLRLDASLDTVVLTSHGIAPRIIDELRIGPTWRSIAPLADQEGT